MLVRDGTLYWGARPIPLQGEPKKLDLASGLIETQVVNSVSADKNFETTPVEREPRRRQLKLTLKGRPDIKPGDVVTLVLPPEELGDTVSSALTSAVSGVGSLVASLVVDSPLTKAYVESVVHRLGRTASFSTVLTCLELKESGDDGWDKRVPSPSKESPSDSGSGGSHADHAAQKDHGQPFFGVATRGVLRTCHDW